MPSGGPTGTAGSKPSSMTTRTSRTAEYLRAMDRRVRNLDRRLVATGADRVIQLRNRHRTAHVSVAGSEVALLRNEAAKKRRHLPVRKLLAAIPTLLSELKPCLMMSPLTVSHFLAPDHEFDLVIFDEASQVPPQDAINCIYRGNSSIVAGDSRQLPPTPFFQVAELDEPGETTQRRRRRTWRASSTRARRCCPSTRFAGTTAAATNI